MQLSAAELVEKLALDDIRYLKLHATVDEGDIQASSNTDIGLVLNPAMQDDGMGLTVYAEAGTTSGSARINVRLAAIYSHPEPFTLSDTEMETFLRRVAVINMAPYIREAITDLASRLRITVPVLPLIPAGEIHRVQTAPAAVNTTTCGEPDADDAAST